MNYRNVMNARTIFIDELVGPLAPSSSHSFDDGGDAPGLVDFIGRNAGHGTHRHSVGSFGELKES